jgi:tetratricopeptide (TPR) repeat protein
LFGGRAYFNKLSLQRSPLLTSLAFFRERRVLKSFVKPILILWPGSTGVLRYGLWGHLGVAILFGIICNIAIFLNFYWIDFLSSLARIFVGGTVLTSWLFLSVAASSSLKKYEKMLDVDSSGEAFLEAQTHYLCGNWFEAECCLKNLLKKNPYDAEALLLKATLYRHLRRFSEARKTLSDLEKIDASLYWREEIDFEKKAIVEDENEKDDEDPDMATSETSIES